MVQRNIYNAQCLCKITSLDEHFPYTLLVITFESEIEIPFFMRFWKEETINFHIQE